MLYFYKNTAYINPPFPFKIFPMKHSGNAKGYNKDIVDNYVFPALW